MFIMVFYHMEIWKWSFLTSQWAIWGSWSICWPPWHHVRQRAAGFDAEAGKKEGDLQKSWDLCGTYVGTVFFFCESQSRAIFNDFQHHLNEFSHFNDSNRSWSGRFVSWFAMVIPWWWFHRQGDHGGVFRSKHGRFCNRSPDFSVSRGYPK